MRRIPNRDGVVRDPTALAAIQAIEIGLTVYGMTRNLTREAALLTTAAIMKQFADRLIQDVDTRELLDAYDAGCAI